MAPGLIRRDSGGLSCWVYGLESIERSRGQDKGEGQEVKAYRREGEEKMDKVPLLTPE